MTPQAATHVPSDRSAETRARILEAALSEFSAYGLAGARTDRIAASAGVNKALLYYYFESKENLYFAALEMISGRIRDTSMALFMRGETSGESVLRVGIESLRPHSHPAGVSEPDAAGDDPLPSRRIGRDPDPCQKGLRAAARNVSGHGARRHRFGRADRSGLDANRACRAWRQRLLSF